MINKLLILLSCTLLFSCVEEEKVVVPTNVLSQQKMAEVMQDVHLLEAAMTLNVYDHGRKNHEIPLQNFDVFDKHQITKQVYDSSFTFYSLHPYMLWEIYQQIIEDLSKIQAEVMNEKTDSIPQKDSLQ